MGVDHLSRNTNRQNRKTMTAEELYDIKQQVEDIKEKLNALAKEYSFDPFRKTALQSEILEDSIFDCVGVLAVYEISKRRDEQ